MRCIRCGKNKPPVNLPHLKSVCWDCFCYIIEKRARKTARINRFFRKGDRILVEDGLSLWLLKRIIKELPVKIIFRKINAGKKRQDFIKRNKISKEVAKFTLDDIVTGFLERNLLNKKQKRQNRLSILSMTDKEAETFAKIRGISFKPNKKNKKIKAFLDNLELKYPEIRFSLAKSVKAA